jgi:N-acetyltransferase
MEHLESLVIAAQDSDWSWMSVDGRSGSAMKLWIGDALRAQVTGTECPFAVRLKKDGKVVGSTRYMDIRPSNRGVEIGSTWYSSRVWATAVNPECKFLLMQHAFEGWRAIRVQLKTDNNNIHSQRAILKLGAKYEGRLRNHRIRRDGSYGDTMMYSITIEEWSGTIKNSLRTRIDAFAES